MISKLCYELYKIDWKRYHMITEEREMDCWKDYFEYVENMNFEEYTYNDYLKEFGYNGEMYAYYDEFCNTEYYDREYMCSLLSNSKLIEMYYKDMEQKNKNLETIKNLIDSLAAYALEHYWNDSDVIDMLIDCGITEQDFIECGYGNFVKGYFSD